MFIFPYLIFSSPESVSWEVHRLFFIKYSELYPEYNRSVVFIKKKIKLFNNSLSCSKKCLRSYLWINQIWDRVSPGFCGLWFGLYEKCCCHAYAPRMGPLQLHPIAHLSLCTLSKVDTPKRSICWTRKGGERKHFWVSVKCLLGKEI